jgi:hypothetical protein
MRVLLTCSTRPTGPSDPCSPPAPAWMPLHSPMKMYHCFVLFNDGKILYLVGYNWFIMKHFGADYLFLLMVMFIPFSPWDFCSMTTRSGGHCWRTPSALLLTFAEIGIVRQRQRSGVVASKFFFYNYYYFLSFFFKKKQAICLSSPSRCATSGAIQIPTAGRMGAQALRLHAGALLLCARPQ